MPEITICTRFYGGLGSITFNKDVLHLPDDITVTSQTKADNQKFFDSDDDGIYFKANPATGLKLVAVVGTVPGGDDGKVEVKVCQKDEVLSDYEANTYEKIENDYTINSSIAFYVS